MDAWGDESIRVVCDPPVYLIAATYRTDGGDVDASALEAMRPKGAHKLHWRDMGDKTKIEAMEAVAGIGAQHTIVMGCRMPRNKQERARRKCLEILLPHLESLGITRYVLESRGHAKDGDDVALLLSLRMKGMCGGIDLAHEEGYKDSRLWVPDQVLGAYGDMRSGVGEGDAFRKAWNLLAPNVNTMEIMI